MSLLFFFFDSPLLLFAVELLGDDDDDEEEDDEEPPPPSKARKQLRPGKAGKATAAKSTKSRPGVMPEDVVEDFAFSDDEMG